MDVNQLKDDVAAGKVGVEQLLELIAQQAEQIAKQAEEIENLKKKIAEKNPTERLDEPYSEQAEEKRQEKRKKKRSKRKKAKRHGRLSTADKIKLAERTEIVFPLDKPDAECSFSHTRVAWRMENGRTVLIAYQIYRHGNSYGKPAGLLGRSEYGIEIIVALAYQVYCLGLSIEKACAVLCFFQQLKLSKSQADRLLNQLARCWEREFETLCTLLANAAVVHCDETSWSINSVWAFLNDKLTVLFYGVHKDGQTLKAILDKDTFLGTLISDDAAVYQGFNEAQKCWAHLLRKAIKLTLRSPEDERYRVFCDGLLELYREAKRIGADRRFGPAGRARKVEELNAALGELCKSRYEDSSTEGDDVEEDYRRLCNELMRLMEAGELFVFVTTAGVEGNNNASERQLRGDAQARDTGRTSKTAHGAKRRSIISSVLQSVCKQIGSFTLERVIEEIKNWMHRGRSCFQEQADASGLRRPHRSKPILDQLVLDADAC